jgi:hypothetical protein
VYVAQDLADPAALTMSVDYDTQVELSKPITIDEGRMSTFSLLRDAVVDAAKAEGRLPSSVSPQEFMLRVRLLSPTFQHFLYVFHFWLPAQIAYNSALIPSTDLPVMWFPAFVSEIDFKIPLVGGVLEVDLIKCRDQYLIEVCCCLLSIARCVVSTSCV